MKLKDYVTENFKQKRVRTIICIFGIILSTMTVLVISLTSDWYQQTATGFFTPFDKYSQIIEKGTNYFQFLPAGSFIDENEQSNIENYFEVNAIPVLLVSYDESISSLNYNYIMGMNPQDIPNLWDETILFSGKWPSELNEVIVGFNVKNSNNHIAIRNETFIVSGILPASNTFMDNIIICDLFTLQTLHNYTNKVSLFFIANEFLDEDIVVPFEQENPDLNFITKEEQQEIKGSMGSFYIDVVELFKTFAIATSLLFVFAIETMNVLGRKKDIAILLIVGTPKRKLLLILWFEIAIITLIGLTIGIPLSLFAHICIYSGIRVALRDNSNFFTEFQHFFQKTFKYFPIHSVIQSTSFIFFGGLIIAIFPALIIFKIDILKEVKSRA